MIAVENFVHSVSASRVVFQPGAIGQLAAELARIGVRHPVLVAGRRTAASPVYEETKAALQGMIRAEFTGVPEHSSVDAVRRLRDLVVEHGVDGFVAIGGGSASDSAKAAALWLAEGGELEDHASRFRPPDSLIVPELRKPKLPIVAVPCTASAAEVTPSLGVRTPDGRKLLFSDPKLASRLIVIDPTANLTVPASLMLSTGMNGLAHCLEGLYSKVRTPVTTALALHGIRLFFESLPQVARHPDSVDARGALLTAAHLSGLVLLNARTCLHHAVCHAIGAVAGVAHGDANSVMLPHAIGFNASSAPAAMKLAAHAMRCGDESRTQEQVADRLARLQAEIGVPARLRDIGVPESLLAPIALKVMSERGLYFNPRQVSGPHEVEDMLGRAW
jgi:alcohol dehydrogenase